MASEGLGTLLKDRSTSTAKPEINNNQHLSNFSKLEGMPRELDIFAWYLMIFKYALLTTLHGKHGTKNVFGLGNLAAFHSQC